MDQISFFEEIETKEDVQLETTENVQLEVKKELPKKKRLPIIEFIEDCSKSLHKAFVKGSQFEVFMESKSHYIILMNDGVFYQPFKTHCKLVTN